MHFLTRARIIKESPLFPSYPNNNPQQPHSSLLLHLYSQSSLTTMLSKYFTATTLLAATGSLAWSHFPDRQGPSTTIIKEPDEGAATLVKAGYGDNTYYCFAQLSLAWGCNGISDTPIGRYQDGTCVPLSQSYNYPPDTVTLTNLAIEKMRAMLMKSLQSATQPR